MPWSFGSRPHAVSIESRRVTSERQTGRCNQGECGGEPWQGLTEMDRFVLIVLQREHLQPFTIVTPNFWYAHRGEELQFTNRRRCDFYLNWTSFGS